MNSQGISVSWTAYGAAGYDSLRDAVRAIKADDVLAPVTLIVPTNLSGTAARRQLAAMTGEGGGGPVGVAALQIMTLNRLAEFIAAPGLAAQGKTPATGPVLTAAWRSALTEKPGQFEPVADNPATVMALVQSHSQIRSLDEAGLDAIACTSPVTADVVRLHREVMSRIGSRWYDPVSLRERAAAEVTAELTAELGSVIVFLPQELDRTAAALIKSIAAHVPVQVIAALTGSARADSEVRRCVETLTGVSAPELASRDIPIAREVRHASDSDDEMRMIVREVMADLQTIPAHRIAVLYASRLPYARIAHEQLANAGIGINGPGVRPTIERVIPRSLLDFLSIPAAGPNRVQLMALLSGAPVRRADGAGVPLARWERISRSAGVVDAPDWRARLEHFAGELLSRNKSEVKEQATQTAVASRFERDAESARELADFVDELTARIRFGYEQPTWAGLADWAIDSYRALFGTDQQLGALPDEERVAALRTEAVLHGVRGLDSIDSAPSIEALIDILVKELGDDLGRTGRFGEGVLVAPVSAAIGLELDKVYVLGLAEGIYPAGQHADALLPERARAAARGELPLARDVLDRSARHLLAAFSSAPVAVTSFPRGDLRRSTTRIPSRWLLPTLRAIAGDDGLAATEWESVDSPRLISSPSFAASLIAAKAPATEQEWRLQAISAEGGSDQRFTSDPHIADDLAVQHAVEVFTARNQSAWSRFDGNLSAVAAELPDPAAANRVVSPTSLEAWTYCPFGYFVERILYVTAVEQPEALVTITPAERGTLIHTVLDRFFRELTADAAVPGPSRRWTPAQRKRLAELCDEEFEAAARKGVTGHPTMWQREQAVIQRQLQDFLSKDDAVRAQDIRTQVFSELTFGMEGAPPVAVALADGVRKVRFRGSADRIDERPGSYVIVDYKSGSATKFNGISQQNPDKGGQRLQLPVYAYAMRQQAGNPGASVHAEYWFVSKDAGKRIGFELTPEVEQRFAHVLTTIVDNVAAGVYPKSPHPDDSWASWVACPSCDPDGLGTSESVRRWEAVIGDPALAALRELSEPAEQADTSDTANAGAPA